MRSGSTQSPTYTDLFWMGDQLPTYDRFDGMNSAMMGLINGGLSGMSLGHSDIGGYTSINATYNGLEFKILRNKEILQRWIEMSTFSDIIMRTHPSNKPASNYQIYSDNQTAQFFAYFVKQHIQMAQYKRDLMNEATQNGIPIVRSLMMNFPDDDQSRKITDQFMLGDHIIIAPIFEEGQMFINLYLPPGTWRHLWTGQVFNGPTRATVYAPIG